MPCHQYTVLKATSQGHGWVTAGERHGMSELASAVQKRHVGDLPAFGTVREWQGSGKVTAGERHGICESALNVWRLAGTLNVTSDFLCCNHQVQRDFLITLYLFPNAV
jgi:hypothetical protein